jgi:hypothetical protein
MTFDKIISTTKRKLIQAFASMDAWFDREDLRQYDPSGSWNTIQLLEHIVNINRELIILMDKPIAEAKEFSYEYQEGSAMDELFEAQEEYPSAVDTRSENEICAELRWQLYLCLFKLKEVEQLESRSNSPRFSERQGMVFYYVNFLVEHVKRHLELYDRVETKYDAQLH